ncbi:MAG: YfhO family protein [Clostridia bacterium]|nr:YfhO family protein [Clostridia bacterium]
MLRAILLDEGQIRRYGYMFDDIENYYSKTGRLESVGYVDLKQDVADRKSTEADNFKMGKNSFTATVTREKDTLVFFSIPHDEGWSATVNGEKVPVEKVNVGFMAVPVKAGESEIVFSYKTPGLTFGIIVSLFAVAMLVCYIVIILLWRRNHPVNTVYPEGDELLSKWEDYENREVLSKKLSDEVDIAEQSQAQEITEKSEEAEDE